MSRSRSLATALALAAPVFLLPASVRGSDRTLPMHFELRTQGPADACGTSCKVFVSAAGAITADTPRNFLGFAQGLFFLDLDLRFNGGRVALRFKHAQGSFLLRL